MKLKGLVLLAAVAALAAALWPAAGSAATFKGIVVAKQRGTLLVASPAGLVRAASGSAAVGSRVVLGGGHATVVGHARERKSAGSSFVASARRSSSRAIVICSRCIDARSRQHDAGHRPAPSSRRKSASRTASSTSRTRTKSARSRTATITVQATVAAVAPDRSRSPSRARRSPFRCLRA